MDYHYFNNMTKYVLLIFLFIQSVSFNLFAQSSQPRTIALWNDGWKFFLGGASDATASNFNDASWRSLDLPHDWSIEGEFSESHPAGVGGGALPGGLGWYRKTFSLSALPEGKKVFVVFDGVYCNSEVWINGHSLGKRPNGYISFQYELTPYLNADGKRNTLAVKVDNSQQPNSRWYSGSGIYRNVWLITTNSIYVDQWGTFIQTPEVSTTAATVTLATRIKNASAREANLTVSTSIVDVKGKVVVKQSSTQKHDAPSVNEIQQTFTVSYPELWTLEEPVLYTAVTEIYLDKKLVDRYTTPFGIRHFDFDVNTGFSLNGKQVKIKGVCLHHDLGCLGAAFNKRAMERQLEIMKAMGVNAVRTSHNPPAPELLDLCDRMGILVMDEAFDMWKKEKSKFDYHLHWDEWHKKDLEDFVLRDRNHPSVIMWSIGNEIGEQWDSTGVNITRELADIVRNLDKTRPITTANNEVKPYNNLIKSGALDVIGFNYHHEAFEPFQKDYPGKKFIATETTSALATRGHYDMPSDSIRRWPIAWDKPFTEGNPDNTVSAYDNVSAPWGSTHEETWRIVKKHDFLSGMFIWTGFDYLGEPTPYGWPSRSSYFGVVDLAGFPKDTYYLYQSEWTDKTTLHVFPHWNWKAGQVVDVWAYYNHADEVELWLNGKSMGVKRKGRDDFHVMWRIPFAPGTIKVVSSKSGKEVLTREIKTAGKPSRLVIEADRKEISASGNDLSFVTVRVVDADGNTVPDADNLVHFKISGNGFIVGVDNGDPVSHTAFKGSARKAFHGLCLAVVQSGNKAGRIQLQVTAEGLSPATIEIVAK
jgi:beta-galactosidase